MKKIIINKLLCMEVSNSIGLYAFKELKVNKNFRNLDILKSFCSLSRQINSDENKDDDKGYIEVTADENVIEYLPKLISQYIFEEITDYEEPNFEWVMEMMSIHDQLLEDDNNDTVQDISTNVASTANVVTDVEEPLQDIKNKDVIEQLNAEMDTTTSNIEITEEEQNITTVENKPILNETVITEPTITSPEIDETIEVESEQQIWDEPEEDLDLY